MRAVEKGEWNNKTILVGSTGLGGGSDELGEMLMRSYLYTLAERTDRPQTMIFMNSGVKLCSEGSPVLEELKALQEKGTVMMACGTCLDYYHLREKLVAGAISNMYEITGLLAAAKLVISL